MSRTKKGKKPVGFEYWGPRPGNKHGNWFPGPFTKRVTASRERQRGKAETMKATRDAALREEAGR